MMRALLSTPLVLVILTAPLQAGETDKDGWVTIFNGKTFEGWKASENVDSWKIELFRLSSWGFSILSWLLRPPFDSSVDSAPKSRCDEPPGRLPQPSSSDL